MNPRTPYRTAAFAAAVLSAALLSACQPTDPTANPGKPAKCNDACSTQPDTVTIEVCWDAPPSATRAPAHPFLNPARDPSCFFVPNQPPWPDGAKGEVTWSKAGVQMYSNTHPLTNNFHRYEAWEHDWAAQGYPEITVTADTNVSGGGVRCFLTYQPPGGGQLVVLDFEQAGYKVGTGQVHCSSATWFKLPGNAGKKPGP